MSKATFSTQQVALQAFVARLWSRTSTPSCGRSGNHATISLTWAEPDILDTRIAQSEHNVSPIAAVEGVAN